MEVVFLNEEYLRTAALVWDGVRHVVEDGPVPARELALAVDADRLPDLADAVVAAGATLVLSMSRTGRGMFELAHDDFGAHVARFGATVAEVEVRWHPKLDPDEKKAQALDLTRLAAWLHETGRSLLVDLDVPMLDREAGDDAGTRADRVLRAARELREVGVEADVWALPGPDRREEAEDLAAFVRDAGRDDVIVLARDDREDGDPSARLRTAAGVDAYRGFRLGPSLWGDVVDAWRDGACPQREAPARIAARVRAALAAVLDSPGSDT